MTSNKIQIFSALRELLLLILITVVFSMIGITVGVAYGFSFEEMETVIIIFALIAACAL